MNDASNAATPASEAGDGNASVELCVLLACFAEPKPAAEVRRQLDQRITQGGDEVLDQVVVRVDAKHKASVYDPRRTLAGTLTSTLTWGVFGLLAGGLQGLAVWAVLGAICGGLYAYLTEHLLTKDELARVGRSLPADSSATVAFVRGADPERLLSSVAAFQPTSASVAAVTSSLSARVRRATAPVSDDTTDAGGAGSTSTSTSSGDAAVLSLVMARFAAEHGARSALAGSAAPQHPEPGVPKVELIIEVSRQGRRRVIDPASGSRAFSLSDAVSWGAFGLAWGAIVGFTAGDGGVLGFIESDLVTGILWTIFGLVAGALYGLWAGRAVSARRLKRVGPLLPPDTSIAVAWADGSIDHAAIERWARTASQRLSLRFLPVSDGAVLES